jgi:hypothetical protein
VVDKKRMRAKEERHNQKAKKKCPLEQISNEFLLELWTIITDFKFLKAK